MGAGFLGILIIAILAIWGYKRDNPPEGRKIDKRPILSGKEYTDFKKRIDGAISWYIQELGKAERIGAVDTIEFEEKLAIFYRISSELSEYSKSSTKALQDKIGSTIDFLRNELKKYE